MVDIVSLGEVLIDLVSTQKNVPLYHAPAFEPKPGGAPANVAVGVQRLGKSAAFIGRVGRDGFGEGLRQMLQEEGVDTRNLLDDPQAHTTLAFVSLSDRGEPYFAIFSSASGNLAPADLDHGLIRSAGIFHFGSVSLAFEPSRTATLEALRIAKAANVLCSYDINWRPAVWADPTRGLEIVKEPLSQVDILKMNRDELLLITDETDPRTALESLPYNAMLVAITMSEKGCMYRFNGKIYTQPVTPVDNVADATGAGDAFMAAMLTGLQMPLQEDALARVMRRAVRAGALATTKRGAIPALPRLADLAGFEV